MHANRSFAVLLLSVLTASGPAPAAELVLPQNRSAYFTEESIELAYPTTRFYDASREGRKTDQRPE